MEPIISPWIIYAASVCLKINQIALAVAVFSLFIIVLLIFIVPIMIDRRDAKEKIPNLIKKISCIAIIAGLLFIVTPEEKTVLAMLTAYYVTPDNIQTVQGNIVDFVKQISDAVNNVTK